MSVRYNVAPRIPRQVILGKPRDMGAVIVWLVIVLSAAAVMWWGIYGVVSGIGRLARYVWG